MFAKTRGGISQNDLTRLALRGLISEAGREAVGYAATILGYDQPRDVTTADLLDGADTPAALVRVAGAVAAGLAETAMYWSSGGEPCRDYLATLTSSGWTPDDWTATVLARHTAGRVWSLASSLPLPFSTRVRWWRRGSVHTSWTSNPSPQDVRRTAAAWHGSLRWALQPSGSNNSPSRLARSGGGSSVVHTVAHLAWARSTAAV